MRSRPNHTSTQLSALRENKGNLDMRLCNLFKVRRLKNITELITKSINFRKPQHVSKRTSLRSDFSWYIEIYYHHFHNIHKILNCTKVHKILNCTKVHILDKGSSTCPMLLCRELYVCQCEHLQRKKCTTPYWFPVLESVWWGRVYNSVHL